MDLRMKKGKMAGAFDRWGTQVETFVKQQATLKRILLRILSSKERVLLRMKNLVL